MNAIELKENRLKLGLTQEELAEKLGLSARTIINYEKGGVIPKSKLSMLERFFQTDLDFDDEIIHNSPQDFTVNDPHELKYIENNNANSFMKLGNGQYLMTMPLAEFDIQAGLLDHYQDIEYIRGLSKHSIIVDEPVKGRYIAFRVKGDSMDSGKSDAILQNYIVSARELGRQHWKNTLRYKDFPYWVIYTTESRMPLLKEIVNHDTELGTVTCHSLNDGPEYKDFTLSLNDIQALFYVVDINRPVSGKTYF